MFGSIYINSATTKVTIADALTGVQLYFVANEKVA